MIHSLKLLRVARMTFIVAVSSLAAVSVARAEDFAGKQSEWHGFARYDFKVDDRASIIVAPEKAAPGNPWVWRARFFGHEPQADVELLKHGYHVAYCDVGNLFGNPQAVAHWNEFYKYVTGKHGFAKKVALEGMSRGGLIIYNWAAANPEKVACLYGDAPVCDFKSWPGGKGTGKGHPASWQACLKAYGLTEEQGLKYDRNPIDQLEPLAKAGVPILHVVGDADDVVPVSENSAIIEQRYRKLGGSIQVISKPGIGHHPHALKDPTPIVEFITKHTSGKKG
jgi:pimeloyl-ACP methyl ester carboxylesterase